MLASAVHMAADKQSELEAHDERNTDLVNRLEDKKKSIAVAKVLSEKKSLKDVEGLVMKSKELLSQKQSRIAAVKKRLMLMESANDYYDYIEYEKELLKDRTEPDVADLDEEQAKETLKKD